MTEWVFVFIILIALPVCFLFLNGNNKSLNKKINVLIIIALLFIWAPIILAVIANGPFHFFIFYTWPIAIPVLLVSIVVKGIQFFRRRSVA